MRIFKDALVAMRSHRAFSITIVAAFTENITRRAISIMVTAARDASRFCRTIFDYQSVPRDGSGFSLRPRWYWVKHRVGV